MRIQELDGGSGAEEPILAEDSKAIANSPTRAVVGIGARFFFYPTLLYNVLRNKIQAEFRWWDEVDQFLLLGAVPFRSDVPRLKQLGVSGVITLNEPYETLVPTSLYHAYGIEHLVLPTRDYLFAPTIGDICQAVDFIYKNVSSGKTTYVHCKAGRGRSTTIVLCYLVHHRQMTPSMAYEYVRLSRPRVLLASSQWKAVQEYYCLIGKKTTCQNLTTIEDGSFVIVSKSDLDGYVDVSSCLWAELNLVYRLQFASRAALTRISCHWLPSHVDEKRVVESCSLEADQLGVMGHSCMVTGVVIKL